MRSLLALAVVALTSTPALARDSSHLVCAGYMAAKPDPDNYGIAIQFDEGRASDGSSRIEMLSSVWAGNLYQGRRLNKIDGFGENGSIVMAAKEIPNEVFYKGSYNLVKNNKTGEYQLQLRGMLTLEPGDSSSQEQISTSLRCVNISN